MAATITHQTEAGKRPRAPLFVDRIRLEGDASYPAGVYPLGLDTLLPGKTILGVGNAFQIGSDWGVQYDRANDKAIVFVISTGAEASGSVAALDVELLVYSQ